MSTPVTEERVAYLRARTRAELDRALESLPIDDEVRIDAHARIARAETGAMAGLERAGLVRAAHSHLEIAVATTRPDWTRVRRLHALWVAASTWHAAYCEGAS